LIGSDRSNKWTRSQDVSRLRLRLQNMDKPRDFTSNLVF
jgi:hypothetical protein